MTDRDSWAVGASDDRRIGPEDARLGVGALLAPGTTAVRALAGIRPGPGDPGKVAATGTPGANVTVNGFSGAINASRGFGPYLVTTDAQKTVAILDVPADPSNQRNDLIVAQQSDVDYGDGNRAFWVGRVLGTPAAVPADPAVTTVNGAPTNSPDYFTLARVRVAAAASTITNAMIDDLRPPWIAALGGLVLVRTQAERDALTAFNGLAIIRLDRKWIEIHDGTAFRVQGVAVCSSTADRDSAITHPVNGQMATTTDTGTMWLRHGGAWVRADKRRIATTTATANSAAVTSLVVVDSISVTGLQIGRRYTVIYDASAFGSVDTQELRLTLHEGTTVAGPQRHVERYPVRTTPASTPLHIRYEWVAAAATADFVVSMERVGGTGTITRYAAASKPTYLLVEDAG